jgi:hypothetical protein
MKPSWKRWPGGVQWHFGAPSTRIHGFEGTLNKTMDTFFSNRTVARPGLKNDHGRRCADNGSNAMRTINEGHFWTSDLAMDSSQ